MTRSQTPQHEHLRPASRRPGVTPGWRFALALVLGVGLLAWSAGVAVADGPSIDATIHPNGSGVPTQASVSISTLETSSCATPPYTGPYSIEMHAGGTALNPDDIGTTNVWSLYTVLGCLNPPVAPNAVTGITVVGSDGVAQWTEGSQIGPSDLMTPSDFADPSEVPLVYTDGTDVTYDRPWRGGTDDNAIDQVRASSFQIEVFEGQQLNLTVTAPQTTVPVGTTVTFGATVTPPYTAPLTYAWSFDGGAQASQTSTSPTPSVTFSTPGTFTAAVQVIDAANHPGANYTTITVTGPTPTTPAPTTTTPAPATGPSSSSGNTPGGAAGTTRTTHPGTSTTSHHHKPTASRKHSTKHKAATHTPATATPAVGGSASPVSASHGTSPAHHRPPKHPAPSPTSKAPLVTGRLIGDVTPLPAGQSPLVHVVPAIVGSAPAVRRVIGASVLPALASALVVLLLFTLGAGRELGWRRNLRAARAGT